MDETTRKKYWELLGINELAGTIHKVDALTITNALSGDRLRARVFVSELANYLASEYYQVEVPHFNKIGIASGWKKGSVAYASCTDWNACAVTGEVSQKALELVLDYEDGIKCTRIDFALDVLLTAPKPDFANVVYDRYPKSKDKLRLIKSVTGSTLYVNSRDSANFGRCYDKSKEYDFAAGSGNVWRFEVEYKTAKAQRLLQGLKLHGQDFIKSVVVSQFRNWDIPLPIIPDFYEVPKLELQLNLGDARLDWLKRCAPSIRALAGRDNRTHEQVRELLNLPMFT